MINLAGIFVAMVVLAVTRKYPGHASSLVATVFLFVFDFFFSVGFVQIPWVYCADITSLATRVQANALSTSTNWVCAFIVVMIAPIAFNNIGWGTYLIFAVCNVAGLIIIYFCYPETRNRSLEEIDLIFQGSSNTFEAVKKANTMFRHFDTKGNPTINLAADMTEDLSGQNAKDTDIDKTDVQTVCYEGRL